LQTNANVGEAGVSRRFLSNTVLNFAGQGFLLLLNIVTAPYIVHHLGAELFGIVALVQTTAGFAGLLNLGIGRALTKYVSELYWKGEVKTINQIFQTAWATCIVSGMVALLLVVGPSETISKIFFRDGPQVNGVAGFAIYVAALGLFSSMLLEAVSALPGALQRFAICNAINVMMGVLRCLGSVGLLAWGYSIRSVLMANLISNLVGVAAFAIVSRNLIPGLSLIPGFNWTAFKRLFRFSLPLILSSLSTLIVTRLDRFILAYFLPLAAVSFYTLPYSLSEKLSMGVTNITSVVFPFTSELHAMNAHEKVQELYLRSTKILNLVMLPLTVMLLAVPGTILQFWLGPEYASQGAVALALLGAAAFLNAASAVPTVTSLGVGRAWMPACFAGAGAVINLVSNFLLIPRYGITGAALGALLPQAIVVPFFVYFVTRSLKFSLWRLVADGFMRPLACAVVQFAILYGLRGYINSRMSLMLVCFVSFAVFGVLAVFVAIENGERSALFGGLSGWDFGRRLASAENATQ
jgi:O-antigen/teichoic acid export membrane protein